MRYPAMTKRLHLIRLAISLEQLYCLADYERQDVVAMDRDDLELYVEYLKQSDRGALYAPIEI